MVNSKTSFYASLGMDFKITYSSFELQVQRAMLWLFQHSQFGSNFGPIPIPLQIELIFFPIKTCTLLFPINLPVPHSPLIKTSHKVTDPLSFMKIEKC